MTLRGYTAIGLACALWLALAASAQAGQYTIHNCPGSSQPNFDAGPWQSYGGPLPSVGGFQSACTPGAPLGPAIGWYANEQSLNSNLGVLLQSPSAAITIRELRLVWSVSHQSGGSDTFAQVVSDTGTALIAPTPYGADAAEVHLSSETHYVYVYSYCSYDASTNCYFPSDLSPVIKLEGMDSTLEEASPPSAANVSGSLSSDGPLSGSSTLHFTATDSQSGVRESQLLIDGSPVLTNSYASQCPFTSFAACPQSQVDSMTWNTAAAANGEHSVALRVTDAAGNTQVLDEHSVQVSNPTASSGAPAAGRAPECAAAPGTHHRIALTGGRTRLTSRYRHRLRVGARLLGPGGTPVANASVEVLARTAVGSGGFSPLATFTTGAKGRFKLTVPPGISRTVCLRYHLLPGGQYAAALAVSDQVSAGVTLSVHPGRVEANGTIILTGNVLGGYISAAGKVVELQVLYLGRWRVFQTIRSRPDGEFTAFYSFLGGHGAFAFRARVRGENNYPYALGYSHPATVRAG